jgi:hypothetical protein
MPNVVTLSEEFPHVQVHSNEGDDSLPRLTSHPFSTPFDPAPDHPIYYPGAFTQSSSMVSHKIAPRDQRNEIDVMIESC